MNNYAKINKTDTVNGDGIRVSIFFSGCNHHCVNCFNSELWDFNYGIPFTDKTINIIIELLKPNYIKGLSVLGGEPFQNIDSLYQLITKVKEIYPQKDIWLWTGYDFSEIPNKAIKCLNYIDILIDGKFIESKKDLRLKFRGSSNQRIIDVQKSLKKGEVVLYEN